MDGSLAASLRLQTTIIHALILQDMSSRYARTRLGMLTAVLEPVAVVAVMYVIRVYVQGQQVVDHIPMILFVVTGFLTDFSFRMVTSSVMGATERKLSSRMFPQVTSMDVITARAVAHSCSIAGAMMVLFLVAALMTGVPPSDVLTCFVAGWLVLLLASSTGLVFGVIVRKYPSLRLLLSSLLRVNIVMSGAAFLATEIPQQMLAYIDWNPTFHIIELMREGWFRGYVSPVADPPYILLCILGLLTVGLPLERLTSRNQSK